MPELPEVETLRRSLAPRLLGRTVTQATADASPRYDTSAEVQGSTLGELRRRGKYLILETDQGKEVIIHLGMTGVVSHGDQRVAAKHTRMTWHLDDDTWVSLTDPRKFGRATVVDAGDYAAFDTLAHLGPEPLGDTFTPKGLHTALQSSTSPVKALLLGQRVVAGVGNIYADEALWSARVHPSTPGDRVSAPRARQLHATIIEALQKGIENQGTTLRNYRTVDGGSGDNQHHLLCYGRGGEDCLRCGQTLRKIVVAGRGTTYCPRCQRVR